MSPVRPAPGTPRYLALAEEIRGAIDRDGYRDNDALPSERELSERYEVSRDTVRKAVRYLEDRGVIYSDPGRGTFVAPAMVRNMSRFIDGFSQNTAQGGARPGQRVLVLESQPASLGLAGLLNVDPGYPLVHLKRVRLVDDAVVGLHDAWFCLPRGSMIEQAEVQQASSIYKLLQDRFGFAPTDAIEHLNAAAAEAEDAALLGVQPGSPILICERVTFSERREPIEYCLMKYVPSYRYGTRISRSSGLAPRSAN